MIYQFVTCFLYITAVASAGVEWHYDDTRHWPELNISNNMCGGKFQTPVPIKFAESIYNPSLGPLSFSVSGSPMKNHASIVFNMTLVNDGHKASLSFPDSSFPTRLNFNDNAAYYARVSHIHWHWGNDNSKGSEHSLDGILYPMEAHLVMYNEALYGSFANAARAPSGLAVFGLFFQIVPDNKGLPLMDRITAPMEEPSFQILAHGVPRNEIVIPEVPIFTLFHDKLSDYYRYMGSLTTPPCTENVLWTVSKIPVPITQMQLNRFRMLKYSGNNHSMVNNFRVLQALNPLRPDMARRDILRSFNGVSHIYPQSFWLHCLSFVVAYLFKYQC
jgi:carbonic anhydrase